MANLIKWQDKIEFSVGDTIKVQQTVIEGGKTRTQAFQGLVIAIRGHQNLKSFVVRKIATGGVGIEKIFPVDTPTITGIEIVKKGKVRRAKLYYLRNLIGKKATKVKDVFVKKGQSATVEATVSVKSTTPEVDRDEAKEGTKQPKVVSQVAKPEKVKKVKKGPKKIVRKEKVFVR